MSDVSEDMAGLEARMTAALARIQAGIEKLPAAAFLADPTIGEAYDAPPVADAGGSEKVAELEAKLEEERTANAQLEQRVRQIKRRQESRVSELEAEVARVQAQLVDIEKQNAKLRRTGAEMRSALEDLQTSARDGGGPEARLINRAMMAELEALRAERAADAADIGALISTLEPLLEGAQEDA